MHQNVQAPGAGAWNVPVTEGLYAVYDKNGTDDRLQVTETCILRLCIQHC